MTKIIDIENINQVFDTVVQKTEWQSLQHMYNAADHVFMIGHGGNLAVAEHAAIDACRLTDKNVMSPGSGITCTSVIADGNFDTWLKDWLQYRSRGLDMQKCLVIGFSCSLNNASANCIIDALNWADDNNISAAMISAQYNPCGNPNIIKVVQDVTYYHTSEILSLMLTYQLIHGAGFECPSILKKCKTK